MAKAKKTDKPVAKIKKEKKKINTKKLLPIIIGSLLCAVLLFGIVVGAVAIVKEARAAVSYKGIRIDKGAASYIASTFKASYGGDAADLEAETEKYIRRVAVAAYLFDEVRSLDKEDKRWIEENVAEVLELWAGGSKDRFNELAAPMGFDYSDFREAAKILYKARNAMPAIYGSGGSNLSYSANAATAKQYFDTYTHVKILFLRTEDKLVTDTDGNFLFNEDGSRKTISMSTDEKAAVAEDVAEITELIENANNNTGVQMSLELFNDYYKKYNEEPAYAESGYYLHGSSEFTEYLRGEGGYPNLVKKALSMKVGEWGKSTDGSIVCFIYKYAPLDYDYADTDMSRFFGDFYSDAANYFFTSAVDELAKDVKLKDKYRAIDVALLEKNYDLKINMLSIHDYWK